MTDDGAYRRPSQVKNIDAGVCCVCGGITVTGIFIRENESNLLCRGRHTNWHWSRVHITKEGRFIPAPSKQQLTPAPDVRERG